MRHLKNTDAVWFAKVVFGGCLIWLGFYANNELLLLEQGMVDSIKITYLISLPYYLIGRIPTIVIYIVAGGIFVISGLFNLVEQVKDSIGRENKAKMERERKEKMERERREV
jgi:hypothetical protein